MTDSIRNKNSDRAFLREVQYEKNQQKKELAEQERQDMKQLKSFYADKRKKLDQDSTAAVSHIKSEQMQAAQEEREYRKQERHERAEEARVESEQKSENARTASVEQNSLYNRQGRVKTLQNYQESAPQPKPLVQNYETKDTDQFYRVQDRGSRISEAHNGYFIEAFAPEHEKDNVKLSILNDRAVVSGKRKFQDSSENEEKITSTNNFQTFREEFRFSRPVTTHGMTREREGDYIRFFIPKLEAIRFDEEA